MEDAAEGIEGAGWLGKLIGIVALIWKFLPKSSKQKIIEAVVEGFTSALGACFDRFQAWLRGRSASSADVGEVA